ncbi:hypothetical protein I4I73_31335 [Pseudonocardia sp. KRD-184]|uniref:Uncharacterized protein n=1 Tax=Pseudonocardia oceani TaxID=2792013 RepID=A0ABS6U4R5_9PSEU|nr:hypothetical protein [Pseudonocardia oceani]MBW0100478.1 hypothetical protein [Pseudonocardia oceani]MBW0125956.1 hypothetical protein [Pseudonocardia oceani]MBW0127222.1 hypothetical protein [Pseudonocardia oceani]
MPGGLVRVDAVPRRRVLAALALAPVALSPVALTGCAAARDDGPDPLIGLADAARSDAALAAALVAADPDLAERVNPLVDARTAHAARLDAEIARLAGDTAPAAAGPAPAAPAVTDLPALRAAVTASGRTAAEAVLSLPAERVGLVASISACCATYAAVLG